MLITHALVLLQVTTHHISHLMAHAYQLLQQATHQHTHSMPASQRSVVLARCQVNAQLTHPKSAVKAQLPTQYRFLLALCVPGSRTHSLTLVNLRHSQASN